MQSKKVRQLYGVLLLGWFVLNLVQAIFTGIHYDEVYYGIWGKHLDWGYFDHPPAVALLTHFSSLFFEGNLGIRFFTVVLHLFTLTLLWNTIDEKYRQRTQSVWLFFIVVAALTMFSVYGFTTTPDTPLMFFAALFLWSYRQFLEKGHWRSVFLLAISMAGLLYSKYHGVLFIGLVVLSHLRLLLKLRFWIAGVLALCLLAPHLWWQYAHDFSSFKFHLSVRSLGFAVKYVLEFVPGQLGVFNPFILGVVFWLLWKTRPQNDFERSLYFLIIGIIGFFALSTYRGRAEAHWTAVASVPMIIMLITRASQQERVKKYVLKYVSSSLILILIARVILLTDISSKFGYEDREPLYRAMERVAGDVPVVFNSSFQDASSYEFYTGKPATTISAIENRQTQYDLWQKEQQMLGDKVFVVLERGMKGLDRKLPFKRYDFGKYDFVGFFAEDWQVSNRLKIHYLLNYKELKRGDVVEIPVEIESPTKYSVNFQHKNFPLVLKVVFLTLKRDYVIEDAEFLVPLGIIGPSQIIKGGLRFKVPESLEQRGYKFSVIIDSFFGHTLNSSFQEVRIK